MATTVEMSVSIQKAIFNRAETLAQRLNVTPNHLFEMAIEDFIRNYPGPALFDAITPADSGLPAANEQSDSRSQTEVTTVQMGGNRKTINQGEIYWVQLANPSEEEAGIAHPYVVIQDNLFNHSRIHTVVVCALTSNRKRISDTPGNLLLEVGEANLPKQSVVEVSKVSSVDKAALGEYIGTLSEQRIHQILRGMRFLRMTFFAR